MGEMKEKKEMLIQGVWEQKGDWWPKRGRVEAGEWGGKAET